MTNTTKKSSFTLPSNCSTSGAIRYLYQQGLTVAKIERELKVLGITTKAGDPIRYQHVRNVLTQVPLATK